MYKYICINICVYFYIYIFLLCLCIIMFIYLCIYMYIYIYILNILHIFNNKNVNRSSGLIKPTRAFIGYTLDCVFQLKAKNCLNLFSSQVAQISLFLLALCPCTYPTFQQESFNHSHIHW